MSKISAELFNPNVLKQCREQLGISLDEAKKKVSTVDKLEEGSKFPTFKQLDTLATLYQVPRWVFITKELPQEYQYKQHPVFRRFKDAPAFQDVKVKKLVAVVEQYRDLFIEFREDLNEPIPPFEAIEISDEVEEAAERVRRWLSLDDPLSFDKLRERVEDKSVFVFLTSKYSGWSKIDREFRGLCISHSQLPIIIINDSDAHKAQSFTLIHELGHLLKGNMAINNWQSDNQEESWCNAVAGSVLIPKESLPDDIGELQDIKEPAKELQVSPYAYLVRSRQLGRITQIQYKAFIDTLQTEYDDNKRKQEKRDFVRSRPSEVKKEFGLPFVRAVLTAHYSQEIGLHKVIQLFGLKRIDHVRELERKM